MSEDNQQLLEYIRDLQEKDKMNKSKTNILESTLSKLKSENDSYKDKCIDFLDQKAELIEIINAKNSEIEAIRKDFDSKMQNLDPSTCGSNSYGIANSESLTKLFKILKIKQTNGRYCEESLKNLLGQFEKIMKIKNHLETDNKYLRDKLDEVISHY